MDRHPQGSRMFVGIGLAALGLGVLAAPLAAQQRSGTQRLEQWRQQQREQTQSRQPQNQQDQNQQDSFYDQQPRQQSGNADQPQTQSQPQSGGQSQDQSGAQGTTVVRVQPEETTLVGLDLDGDGLVDTWYAIRTYDVEMARRQLRDRMLSQGDRLEGNFNQGGGSGSQPDTMNSQNWRTQSSSFYDDQPQDRSMRGTQQNMQQQDQSSSSGQQTTVSGTITTLMRTSVVGSGGQPHLLALIRTDNGDTDTVDLGPARQLQMLALRQGDDVIARGSFGTFNNRPVMFANWVGCENGSMPVSISSGSGNSMMTMNRQRLDGTITQLSSFTPSASSSNHLMAKVRSQDGDSTWVDLGPRNQLRQFQPQQGDTVSIIGVRDPVGGGTILRAERLHDQDENQTIRIQNPMLQQQQQQSQQFRRNSGQNQGRGQSQQQNQQGGSFYEDDSSDSSQDR